MTTPGDDFLLTLNQ